MKIASIDIGTNTALLLIAEYNAETGILTPIHHEQRFPRIGRDVDSTKTIQQPAFDRTRLVLLEYAALCALYSVDTTIACATSAVRDAVNKNDFTEYMYKETGIAIEVISGEEEARLTYLGAISGMPKDKQQYVVLDIGGGSTEISFSNDSGNFHKSSLQIGSVRLTERYLKHNPPLPDELSDAVSYVQSALTSISQATKTLSSQINSYALVGVAGTVTTLACLEQQLMEFDVEKVSGFRLTKATVKKWLEILSSLTHDEILKLSNTTQGRADILTAGTLILFSAMNFFDFSEVIVSERGLRYGMILREL